ncbi:Dbl-like domain-containing protein [Atractiella rhizophila]|nr:Dbl-like domain-containing protein [Atractiella rhizophila]
MGIVDEDEFGADDFFNPALLSNIALHVKDKVPKGFQIKGAVEYPRSFTGKDVVNTILAVLPVPFNFDRRLALTIARYLQDGLFFHEVDWSGKTLRDGVDDVYIFDEDEQKFHMEMGLGGGSSSSPYAEEENILGELPTGVLTKLTNCYSPFCNRLTSSGLPGACYSTTCPNRIAAGGLERAPSVISITSQLSEATTVVDSLPGDSWRSTVPEEFINQLDATEIKRQELIFELISSEREYLADFDLIQSTIFEPLRTAVPPIIEPERIVHFFEGILDCVLNIREHSKVFFESLLVRQREQTPLVRDIGAVILGAAVEWGELYIRYAKNLPFAINLVKIEKAKNEAFTDFVAEFDKRKDTRRRDLEAFQQVPIRRLLRYSLLVDQLVKDTPFDSPDREYLSQANDVIKEQCVQMQDAQKKGEKEAKRQLNINELIEGEQAYWKDLDLLEKSFVTPLYQAQPPIIGRERLRGFLNRTLSNVFELRDISLRALDNLLARQREEAPKVQRIGDVLIPMLRPIGEAYIAFVANSPFSEAAVKDEAAQNTAFKTFIDEFSRLPEAKRLPITSFLTRPTFRVPRLPLLIKEILDHTDADNPDLPLLKEALDIIKDYIKKADETIAEAKLKYSIIEYNADIVRKPGDGADLDLLNPNRRLFHRGTLLRKPDGALGDWTELHVILFDNYFVMTKPREQRDGKTKFYVSRRAIPLELLQPLNFSESASVRTAGLRGVIPGSSTTGTERNPSDPYPGNEDKSVYPLTFRYLGRHGEVFTLHADTKDARAEWQKKVQEAIAFRQEMLDASKVFTLYAMSDKTFGAAPYAYGVANTDGPIERHGPPTCSCPISTSDNRRLVAIGCADGVWIGLRSNPQSLRRVIHLNDVTQLAVLQQFGFLLVLSEKRLFAYPLEVVIPTAHQAAQPGRTPQQISGEREVLFFKVGKVRERTLVTYCKRATTRESLFIALEPVASLDHSRQHAGGFMRGLVGGRQGRPEYFRTYKDFFVPSESYSIQFLRSSLAILCKKGVEIMNLETLKPTTVPDYSRLRNDPRAAALQRRCDDGKALGMFRLEENVFLICYSDLAFWTDKYGDPIPSRYSDIFDWEGAPQNTVYQPPHILAFDSNFIEIRNAFTGKLVQIIKGEDIVCTYDGSAGGDASRRSAAQQPPTDPGEGRVHVSIKVERRYHKIFELVDTRNGEGSI